MDDLMMTLEVLVKARELLSDPARWTQGCFARTIDGAKVRSRSKNAVCFCSVGALRKVGGSAALGTAIDLLEAVVDDSIDAWNDDPWRTHADVLAAFDAAILKAKESAQ